MILTHKRFYRMVPAFFVYMAAVLCITLFTCKGAGASFLFQVFMDKVYCYLLTPPFLWGIFFLDESLNKPALIRIGSRRKALHRLLSRQYLFAVLYLAVWFVLTALFAGLAGESVSGFDFLGKYGRYLCGLFLLVNSCGIFKRLGGMAAPAVSFGEAYMLLLLDVLVIPVVTDRLGPSVKLVFPWIFSAGGLSCLILAAWLTLSFILLLRRNNICDIF